jgi:hypothetical protein
VYFVGQNDDDDHDHDHDVDVADVDNVAILPLSFEDDERNK